MQIVRERFRKRTAGFPYDILIHLYDHIRHNADKYNKYGALVKLLTEENGKIGGNLSSVAHCFSTNPTLTLWPWKMTFK